MQYLVSWPLAGCPLAGWPPNYQKNQNKQLMQYLASWPLTGCPLAGCPRNFQKNLNFQNFRKNQNKRIYAVSGVLPSGWLPSGWQFCLIDSRSLKNNKMEMLKSVYNPAQIIFRSLKTFIIILLKIIDSSAYLNFRILKEWKMLKMLIILPNCCLET